MYLGYRTTAPRSFRTALLLAASVFLCVSAHAQEKDVIVVAAEDMQPVFAAYAPLFEQRSGLKLRVSYASPATLVQQIQNGSQADIFFSDDYYFAEQAVASKLTVETAPVPYAKGMLALWTRKDSRFSKPLTIDVLSRNDLKSVAVANPDHAPYGRAAMAALKRLKVYGNVAPHIVETESIAEAAQLALSGKAELVLLPQSIVVSPQFKNSGMFALIPFGQYPEIVQTAVVLKNGKHHDGAEQLLKFMLSDKVQADLPSKGLKSVP